MHYFSSSDNEIDICFSLIGRVFFDIENNITSQKEISTFYKDSDDLARGTEKQTLLSTDQLIPAGFIC